MYQCECNSSGFCQYYNKDITHEDFEWCKQASNKQRVKKKRNLRNEENSVIKPFHIPVSTPKKIDKIAVINCFFNPLGYKNLTKNWYTFFTEISKFDVDVHTIELGYGKFFLPEDKYIRRITANLEFTTIWQKERLLNILIGEIAQDYDAICWIDADIVFENDLWIDGLRETLEKYEWCQLYENSFWQNSDESKTFYRKSCGWAYHKQQPAFLNFVRSHPGFAWGARSSFLQDGGLYDRNILGGGDSFMLYGLNREEYFKIHKYFLNHNIVEALRQWSDLKNNRVKSFGYVDGDITHLYHGELKDRNYIHRQSLLYKHNYEPFIDVEICEDTGILKWSDHAIKNKPKFIDDVRNYFKMRKEDK